MFCFVNPKSYIRMAGGSTIEDIERFTRAGYTTTES